MRIVLLNDAVDPKKVSLSADWKRLNVWESNQNIYTADESDLWDYDVFIANANKLAVPTGDPKGRGITAQINEIVGAGGCLIVFAHHSHMNWSPLSLSGGPATGEIVQVEQGTTISDVLQRYKDEMKFHTRLPEAKDWTTAARAKAGYPVALFRRYNNGAIIVLPDFKRPDVVVRDLLEQVVPKVAPLTHADKPRRADEPPPEWLDEYTVEGVKVLAREISALAKSIEQQQEAMASLEAKRVEAARYSDLLWAFGETWLEPVVRDALTLLGVPCEPDRPKDLVHRFGDGQELWMEVEGTTGPIKVDKGSQLLRYMTEEIERHEQIHGAIIGNPYRLEPPNARPPAGAQAGLFSPPLVSLAKKQRWPLITTTELFRLVQRHFKGEQPEAAAAVRRLLRLPPAK